jgi:hypothetical protein
VTRTVSEHKRLHCRVTFTSVDNRFIGRFIGRFYRGHNLLFINNLADSQASNEAANLADSLAGSCDSIVA